MARRTLALPLVALLAAAGISAATAKSMYVDTFAKEQAVRTALATAGADQADVMLKAVHEVVSGYDAIVRMFPASGYSDDALWQGGRLSLDAFAKFGQPREKTAGMKMLNALAAQYPTSKFAKQVPAILQSLGAEQARPLHSTGATAHASVPHPSVGAELARPPAEQTQHTATIKNIRREVLPDSVRVTIELDSEVTFHDERLNDPARVFVDLPSARAEAPLKDQTLRFDGDADVVRQIRIGRHPNNTTRVVLDAAGVSTYSVYALYDPYRLVIDCARTVAATPPPLVFAPIPTAAAVPASLPGHVALPPLAIAATPHPATNKPGPVIAPPPSPPGSLSIARQLGLGVSRIVIDPGHGGHDPGAKGKGVTEADLVLDIALRLEKLLQKIPGVEVILTRRTDDFVPLPERTAIANRENADLFISIHANSSPNASARGIETYFLNFANNQSAAAVAARENAESTQAMGALPDFVKAIALNNKLDESRDLATKIQHAMYEKLHAQNKAISDRGVKQAPLVVLIGAAMPAVLAEIAFVTNPQESKLLRSGAYKQKIAEALLTAVRKYQTSLKSVTSVASQ